MLTLCCRGDKSHNHQALNIALAQIASYHHEPLLMDKLVLSFDGVDVLKDSKLNPKCSGSCDTPSYDELRTEVVRHAKAQIRNVAVVALPSRGCLSNTLKHGMAQV